MERKNKTAGMLCMPVGAYIAMMTLFGETGGAEGGGGRGYSSLQQGLIQADGICSDEIKEWYVLMVSIGYVDICNGKFSCISVVRQD